MIKGFKTFFNNYQLLDICINKIKKIPWILGRYVFLFILIFILLGIIFGEFLFWRYVFLVNIEEPKIVNISTKFEENTYQSVLKELQVRENIFLNLQNENYTAPLL